MIVPSPLPRSYRHCLDGLNCAIMLDADAQPRADSSLRPSTPDSDEHPNVVVTVPPLDKTTFVSWGQFHEYLAEYQQRTFQVYSTRTATPVSTRNKRIQQRYADQGRTAPSGELLPEEMGTYSKAYVCTHHGQPRPRATGQRTRKPSRAINCPARITLVLKKDASSGNYFVHVSSHTARHNHVLSGGEYRRHPKIRKITDTNVLRTVSALQKADAQPRKILEFVRENTDKDIELRDVHNLLAMIRKNPSLVVDAPSRSVVDTAVASTVPASASYAASAIGVADASGAPPSAVAAQPSVPASAVAAPPPVAPSVGATPSHQLPQSVGPPERSSHFARASGRQVQPQPPQPRPQSLPQSYPQVQHLPPPAPARELPTQYGKFLAAFNVGKEVAGLMAEMDATHFAHCYAELRMFLRVAESGRVPCFNKAKTVNGLPANRSRTDPASVFESIRISASSTESFSDAHTSAQGFNTPSQSLKVGLSTKPASSTGFQTLSPSRPLSPNVS
ncbi:unnamed protein product [Phytophthora fragariaefolia]|uniref:Unnamed protein product n=1 Tax=Phytophthora fragariaefolia TaxID=1490495 RepID=A0A9W7D2T0_9STRA|nr:unnamed protein product [Phytophthora fragariaefolia]